MGILHWWELAQMAGLISDFNHNILYFNHYNYKYIHFAVRILGDYVNTSFIF